MKSRRNSVLKAELLLIPCALLVVMTSGAAEFKSTARRATLVELYTSEGCSSCPPADRWFTTLKRDPRLWTEIVPVAFHVDYWDYIGWRDIFAVPENSQRQRHHARSGNVSTVYTPGFVVNGHEWRGWFGGEPLPLSKDTVGTLSIEHDGNEVAIEYTAQQTTGALTATVAILGCDLVREIESGENRGRRLTHDFVVLGRASVRLVQDGSTYSGRIATPAINTRADRLAVATWITDGATLIPIQAAGGWLDGP